MRLEFDEKASLPNTNPAFCHQAQAFYERELEAMKRTQQLTADNLLAWKRTEAELRREFQSQEAALQKTLGKLRAELARVSDEARDNRDKCHKLQTSLTTAENNVKVSLKAKPRPPTHVRPDPGSHFYPLARGTKSQEVEAEVLPYKLGPPRPTSTMSEVAINVYIDRLDVFADD